MQRLPEAMARLAVDRGVTLRLGEAVSEVALERGRVAGVTLASGERLPAGGVVVNADVSAVATGLLGGALKGAAARVPPEARSLSALTLSVHAPTGGFPLGRHNVFFCDDYEGEFRDVMGDRRLPRAPTVYVCAQDRTDDGAEGGPAAGAPERLFAIINAPAIGDRERFEEQDVESCARRGLDLLRRCGLAVTTTPETCRITSPADFERRFPATGGALYGRATHGPMATFQRPASRTKIPGLYLTGGSVHPGPGIAMAALSGRVAARNLLADWASIGRSRDGATPGGTSTP
jgi:1-hydroxycarotenoid 3,4-desaturase